MANESQKGKGKGKGKASSSQPPGRVAIIAAERKLKARASPSAYQPAQASQPPEASQPPQASLPLQASQQPSKSLGKRPAQPQPPQPSEPAQPSQHLSKSQLKRSAQTQPPQNLAEKKRSKLTSSTGGGSSNNRDNEEELNGEGTPRRSFASSNSSNPSPPSQQTTVSQNRNSTSRTNTIPLQYNPITTNQNSLSQQRRSPAPSNLAPQNLNLNQPIEEESDDDEEDEEEDQQEDKQDEQEAHQEEEEAPPNGVVFDKAQAQGQNDEERLANLLALPGRQRLPLLSEEPVPNSLWFTRDKGKLTRVIATIFRRKFDGPFFSWTKTPTDKQERYFRTFAGNYYWDLGLTELVKEHFWAIAVKRMKGIVSQAKNSGKRPIWIEEPIWEVMWQHWRTIAARNRSTAASNSRNSQRNGLGPRRHLSGQSSYLTIQQEMEESLGRPVSFAEVFRKTHTLPDGSFVDLKAQHLCEVYEKSLQEVRDQVMGEGPEVSDSEQTTQRQISVEEQNDLFLECTEIDPKGNPYGLGQLAMKVKKGKGKISDASTSTPNIDALQDELEAAREKIAELEEQNRLRDLEEKKRDEANARRDQDLQQSQARLAQFERLVAFMAEDNPRIAEFLSQEPPPSTTEPPAPNTQPPQ